jgi:hypothetical protein
MQTLSHNGEQYILTTLNNCNDRERYDAWNDAGGTLLGNKNLGCGINSLTYLGVFTRAEGESFVKILNERGTTFTELMNYVYNKNGQRPQFCFYFDISNLENARVFTRTLESYLCDNCCTIAKLMRYPDEATVAPLCNGVRLTSGHTIIFSKRNGIINTIDPNNKLLEFMM